MHRIRDAFGLFVHATHGRNLSAFKASGPESRDRSVSDPVPVASLPNAAMRAMLATHKAAFHDAEDRGKAWRPLSAGDPDRFVVPSRSGY